MPDLADALMAEIQRLWKDIDNLSTERDIYKGNKMAKVENAQVDSLLIGLEDHGIPSFSVGLKIGDCIHQGFGGYDLRYEDYATRLITGLCRVFSTNNATNIVGKFCRVESVDGRIKRIGHITKDEWLEFR
jgi:hypothetical protein